MQDLKLLFIHGTAGSPDHFAPQLRYFSSRYPARAPALAWRGQGQPAESVEKLTERLIYELGPELREESGSSFIAIGHSLGGLMALELARRVPERIRAVVLIDVPMLFPTEISEALAPLAQAFRGPHASSAIQEFASSQFFRAGDESAWKTELLRSLLEFPAELFAELFEASGSYDARGALRDCRVPGLFLHSSVPIDLMELNRLAPGIQVARLPDTGHYAQLERAEEVNRAIEGLLSKLSESRRS